MGSAAVGVNAVYLDVEVVQTSADFEGEPSAGGGSDIRGGFEGDVARRRGMGSEVV